MVKVKPVQNGRTSRMSFSRINEVIGMPNLIEIQKNSYNWFLDEGLREVFHDIDAIEDYTGNLSLEFVDYRLDKHPKYTIKECKERDATYAAPLYVTARLLNKSTGEVKEQEIFMGDFPLMTDSGTFISNGAVTEICFLAFALFTLGTIFAGVRNGVERVSKVMMPVLVVLSVIITAYSVTRPGALAGVKYFLVPNPANFSWMTVVTAMGQMFYSLSIAMGILVTFGSYMKKDVAIENATQNVEVFDTIIAVMAGLMIIPAVFAFSDGDPDNLQAGPALMFITLPKVFASMGLGSAVGVLFFVLVLFAAVTSSIALTESAVSTFQDELGWSRRKATVLVGVIMVGLGTLSSLGYGPLAGVTVLGMQFLDFFDFLTNSVMMPIAAIATCLLVSRVVGVERIEHEVTLEGGSFRRKKIFNFMIRWLCPVFAAIILASSVANAFGIIAM